jgi:hypothetical protein
MGELFALMSVDKTMGAVGGAINHGYNMHQQNDAQKHQKEMVEMSQAFASSELTKAFRRQAASGVGNAGLSAKLMNKKTENIGQLMKASYNMKNQQAATQAGIGNTDPGPTRGYETYDDNNRRIQNTVGGNEYVQEWDRKPKKQGPKTADTMQQTGWGKTEVARIHPYVDEGPGNYSHIDTQYSGWENIGTPIDRSQMDNSQVGAETSNSNSTSNSTSESGVGDGGVHEYARLNAMDNVQGEGELNTTTPVNQDGNVTMIDDDEVRGTSQA